jgi:hypothetical protein
MLIGSGQSIRKCGKIRVELVPADRALSMRELLKPVFIYRPSATNRPEENYRWENLQDENLWPFKRERNSSKFRKGEHLNNFF